MFHNTEPYRIVEANPDLNQTPASGRSLLEQRKTMKILFADAIDSDLLDPLREAGHELEINPDLGPDTLVDAIAGADILVVRSTKVPAAVIDAADKLSLIVRSGAGTDNIDTDCAADRGIYVSNVPGRNALAVAELAMGLLVAVDRRIAANTAALRDGTWNKKEFTRADGLHGRTMGIIGLGSIGLAVAERARAFGISVIAVRKPGRSAQAEQRIRSLGIRLVDTLSHLLTEADIVSVHVPKNADTIGMIDGDFLGQLKPDAILLNTARGETMVEADLLAALDNGLRAGLDVYPNEPGSSTGEFDSPIAKHPNVVGTHHIGASTSQAQHATVTGTIEVITGFCTGDVMNCINMETAPLGSATLNIRHADRVGVLASIFTILQEHGINVQQMENRVFRGSEAAVAVINVDGDVSSGLLEQIDALPDIFGIDIAERAAGGTA